MLLPALGLGVFSQKHGGGDMAGDSGALRFQPEAAGSLPVGGYAVIGDTAFHGSIPRVQVSQTVVWIIALRALFAFLQESKIARNLGLSYLLLKQLFSSF